MQRFYFFSDDRKFEMVQYKLGRLLIYIGEFPTNWRDTDYRIEEFI